MRNRLVCKAVLLCAMLCFGAGHMAAKTARMDTIEYKAQVWIDKADLERYGGEAEFKSQLKGLFHNTTRFWNESPNKFKYYFRYVPADELVVYDTGNDPSRYDEYKNKAFGELDVTKADFVLFLALNAPRTGLSCGGGGKSGQAVVMCYLPSTTNMFTDAEYPKQGTYSNLGHEYGHVRGANDLYQYIIKAEDNPVSHEALVPPKCNMGTGYRVWSDYCSSLFNRFAHHKQLPRDMKQLIYPEKLVIKVVDAKGKKRSNATVNLYGTRAGGKYNNRDVYPHVYRTYQTNKKGLVEVTEVYKLYHPDETDPNVPPKRPKDLFPYSYWFCFLVEVTDGTNKTYAWLPEFEILRAFLDTGNKAHVFKVTIP